MLAWSTQLMNFGGALLHIVAKRETHFENPDPCHILEMTGMSIMLQLKLTRYKI